MKIPYHFLLAAAFAASQPLLADSQSLSPSDRPAPLTNHYLFTPKQPLGSIWQPLRTAPVTQFAPTKTNAAIYPQSTPWREKKKYQPLFPTELPDLNYKDIYRDDDGRLHLPTLSQPGDDNAIRTLRPDNMPCLVPNLARVERMPVDRRGNADPINRMIVPAQRLSGH